MKEARSMAELEQLLMAEMEKAMNVVFAKAEQDTKTEVKSFYSQGSPSIYQRTGQLGNSVKTKGVSKTGKSVNFSIWLDRSYSYAMPNPAFTDRGYSSYFTTPMVFEAAEAGTANIKGRSGFWARSEQKIKSDLDSVFASFFN